jgi:hypothetical protein
VAWNVSASLDTEYFSAPLEIRVPAKLNAAPGRALYPLTFAPVSVKSVHGQLILRDNTINDWAKS